MFITVEGPIGVGKTSLAHIISQHFSMQMLNEIVEENPFLGKFYEDIDLSLIHISEPTRRS